ncbi:hypothetical protein AAFF_G00022140 [Aldrovandia affinis]|uniref:Uncharacterized protein n=1 Tax=Aldrovandia affinis TaxID=143900 RepID=A0AAD7S7B9_9TELE|nr:hypothetical protein AAFF_G00022140 [Aldrovandia affinis]
MLAAGVIEPSDSPWVASAGLVKKKDDSWRFCVDYRHLNAVTKKDSYRCRASMMLWITSAVPAGLVRLTCELGPDARPKTAFTIRQGLWHFWVMPFGLCNAPATFERLMERVLAHVP